MDCPFCAPRLEQEQRVVLSNDHCLLLEWRERQVALGDALLLVPRDHRPTVFDLTPEEWAATHELLGRAKDHLDRHAAPDGYNVGWNCGRVGGQDIFHAHLHVIPRHRDEPLAGQGIRYHLKQPLNARPRQAH